MVNFMMTRLTYVIQIYQRKRLETLRKRVFEQSEGDRDGLNNGREEILRRLQKSKG